MQTNQRINLRPFCDQDASFILQLLNTDSWLHFIGDRNVHSEEQAIMYLQNGPYLSYKLNGYGLQAITLIQDGSCIGMAGLLKRNELLYPDIGFALLPAFEGKGFAEEAARIIIQQAKELYALHRLMAITLPENTRSIRLLEKLGFHFHEMQTQAQQETLAVYMLSLV